MSNHTIQNIQDTVTLHNGVQMPRLGLGVFQVADGPEVVDSVKAAIGTGYRSIDTAAIYGNEASVGQGMREAITEHGVAREALFVTSKVWNADLGYDATLAAYEASMQKLGLAQLDLYLIHWPVEGKYSEAWRALEDLYLAGRVRAIGVSNFHVRHLETLMQTARIKPMVNQVELHPMLAQQELDAYCLEHGIQLEAWSPLMQGQLLEHPVLQEIGARHGKSVAQVILRWDLQRGIVTIPKSTKPHRIQENASLFDFELSAAEMQAIDALNENRRVGPDPDNFDF
ncbi:aldo/keto reductase [Paenibacillus ferrarius]|uniref:aldo/keto reductase n=1 Tax=Paenibacillus ferrarius TaxID=1469647 RepID=UPI003D2AEF63